MAKMVVEIPEGFEHLGEAFRRMVETASSELKGVKGLGPVDYGAIERKVAERGADIERAVHGTVLKGIGEDVPSRFSSRGDTYVRVTRSEGTYYTCAGGVGVMRWLYRREGHRNEATVDPIGMRTGAIGGNWLPETVKAVGHLMQQGTSREAEATSRQLARVPYSRAAFEDVAHALGAEVVEWESDMQPILMKERKVPDGLSGISVALDRVALPMEEARERPAGRPKKGAPKRPIKRVYRMAYCGTLTLHDEKGEAIETIRMGRMPGGAPEEMCAYMVEHARHLLTMKPGLHVSALADGAQEMWDLLRSNFNKETLGTAVTERVDFWHVAEKLGEAAAVIAGDDADGLFQRWKLNLLNRKGYADVLLKELRASGKAQVHRNGKRPVADAIRYIKNRLDRLDYATARELGLPVGSGDVEATCKSLVSVRMKRPGARWKQETGQHIMHLRAAALSSQWDEMIDLLFELRSRDYEVAA